MKQQPDKLFREKLSHHSRPVPARAWERLEIQLDHKTNRAMWLNIAASLLLIGVATFLLWPFAQPAQQNNITNNNIPVPLPQPDTDNNPLNDQAPSVLQENKSTIPAPASDVTLKEHPPIRRKNKIIESIKPAIAPLAFEVGQPEVRITHNLAIQQPVADLLTAESIVEKQAQPVVLIFSAAETNEYLDKKIKYEATPAHKKASALKKLLTKATALKNNQDPLGDLRELKNNILALDRSNRRREQTK